MNTRWELKTVGIIYFLAAAFDLCIDIFVDDSRSINWITPALSIVIGISLLRHWKIGWYAAIALIAVSIVLSYFLLLGYSAHINATDLFPFVRKPGSLDALTLSLISIGLVLFFTAQLIMLLRKPVRDSFKKLPHPVQ